jgi:MFS family permease
MFITVGTLILGRFLMGLGSGIITVIASVYMGETIPSRLLGIYGIAVNFGIVNGLLITSVLQGTLLPSSNEVTESVITALRFNFATPGILAALNIGMFLFTLEKDSLFFLMESRNEVDSLFQF